MATFQSPEGGRLIEVGLSSPLLCCCLTAGLKSSLNLLIEIKKQLTAVEQGHQFSWFIFYKKRKTYLGKIEATLLTGYAKSILFAVNNLRIQRDSTPRFTQISFVLK